MLVDQIRIRISGGDGGNGCCSFRREKYVPRGGPNGGDGGKGGDVLFVAQTDCSSLLHLRFHQHYKAERGEHGQGSDCHGKMGKDLLIPVPPGTLIRTLESRELLADLVEEGQTFPAAHGGKGGRGNARFANATHKAPRFAELGEPGEEREYFLELKLIADVGIVGLPNAGKSTLLSAVSAARPKIADYPFTTLSPNLGVASLSDFRTLTLADIPGIIEGAADGKGLGHDFLRHIERTRLLLFLIDLGDPDPLATREVLENELAQHSPAFAGKPRVYALSKADIPENRERFPKIAEAFGTAFLISGVTGEGVPTLLEHLWEIVDRLRREPKEEVDIPEGEYTYESPFEVTPVPDGFRVEGKRIRQAVSMTNFDNADAVRFLHHKLSKMGVFKALKRMGAEAGQTVYIEDVEFEYHPD